MQKIGYPETKIIIKNIKFDHIDKKVIRILSSKTKK